jgi:hypothetical protein
MDRVLMEKVMEYWRRRIGKWSGREKIGEGESIWDEKIFVEVRR